MKETQPYRLELLGGFRLYAPDGRLLNVRSRKAVALLAMLATSRNGERTRIWLQDRLWSLRELKQQQASLRREVHGIRAQTENFPAPLIEADPRAIRLNLQNVVLDLRDTSRSDRSGEFLEGFDIASEPTLTAWLEETRSAWTKHAMARPPATPGSGEPLHLSPFAPRSADLVLQVVPLELVSGNDDPAAQEILAASMRLLVQRLSQSRWFPISVKRLPGGLAYKDPLVPPNSDAPYRLFGELSVIKDKASLSLTILSYAEARLLWSDTITLPKNLAEERFRTAILRVTNHILEVISYNETQAALSQSEDDLDVHHLIWRARYYLQSADDQGLALARDYLDRALTIAPQRPEIIILNALHKIVSLRYAESLPPTPTLRAWAQAAMGADPNDPRGPLAASFAEIFLSNVDQAIEFAEKAIEISPGFVALYEHLGICYTLNGQFDIASTHFEHALDLSPHDWRDYHTMTNLALACTMQGEHEKAVELCDRSLALKGDHELSILVKIHALVHLDRRDLVESVVKTFGHENMDKVEKLIRRMRFRDPKIQQSLSELIESVKASSASR